MSSTVVGFDAKSIHVLIRQQQPGDIVLVVVSLKTGKAIERFDILHREDPEKQQATLRQKRWKAAETQLKARGFSVVPDYAPVKGEIKSTSGKAFRLEEETETNRESGSSGTILLARRGAASIELVQAVLTPPGAPISFSAAWQSPDGQYIVTAHDGCSDPETFFVFSVKDIDERLTLEEPDRTASAAIDWVPSRGMKIARTETTVAQYRPCVRAGACNTPTGEGTWSASAGAFENHPITNVGWAQATAFCRWVGGRLPTGDEWQRVASNGGTTVYPWGDASPNGRRANFYCLNDGFVKTSPACSFSAGHTMEGVCDLAGNVTEWIAPGPDAASKEVRGGAWSDEESLLSAAEAATLEPAQGDDTIGFRCAR